MNIENYKFCIESLEKEIKSRQQERISMQNTLKNINKQLNQQINKSKMVKQQNTYLTKTKDNLLIELKKKQDIINEKNSILNNSQSADTQYKKKIIYLETQNKQLQEQLKEKQMLLSEKNMKIRQFDSQCRKNASLVQGYKNIVTQKAKQLARNQTKVRQLQLQKQSIVKELFSIKQQHELHKQEILKTKQSQGNANQIIKQQNLKIQKLQRQILQQKDLHKNQVQTIKFNHAQQKNTLQNEKRALQHKIQQLLNELQNLKTSSKQMKRIYDSQVNNKDQVVNTLIEQINFLKQEKQSTIRQNQLKAEQVMKSIIQMSLEASKLKNQRQAYQRQVESLKSRLKQNGQQNDVGRQRLQKQKLQLNSQVMKQNNEIQTLSSKIQQLVKQRQALKSQLLDLNNRFKALSQQKQSVHSSSSQIISSLKKQMQVYSQKITQKQLRIKQLTQTNCQLEQKINQLSYQKSSSHSSKNELVNMIKSHQFTIQKMQVLLEQSRKINVQLSNIVNTKVNQVNILQANNSVLRNQKLQWIKRQQDYRKKIIEYRNTASFNNKSFKESRVRGNAKKFMQSAFLARHGSRKSIFQNSQFDMNHAGGRAKTYGPNFYLDKSQISPNSPSTGLQKLQLEFYKPQTADIQLQLPCLMQKNLNNNDPVDVQNVYHREQQIDGLASLDAMDSLMKKKIKTDQSRQGTFNVTSLAKNQSRKNQAFNSNNSSYQIGKLSSSMNGINKLLDNLNKQ